jgi:hypothetical protein
MSFRLQTYTDVRSFAEKAFPHLLSDEPRNNLQIGLLRHGLTDSTFAFDYLATAESPTGQVVGALTRTPGRSLIISALPHLAHNAVIDAIPAALPDLIGLLGPPDTLAALAPAVAQRLAAKVVPHTRLGMLTLQSVTPPKVVPGRFETAQHEHLPVVLNWMSLFHEELPEIGAPPPAASTEQRLHDGLVFLWLDQDSRPVSMAIRVRDSPHGGIIGYVYTPRGCRGLGFASNCVARTSQAILDGGKDFCGLFVDLTNPVSTRMYANLGYTLVAESHEVRFAYQD